MAFRVRRILSLSIHQTKFDTPIIPIISGIVKNFIPTMTGIAREFISKYNFL